MRVCGVELKANNTILSVIDFGEDDIIRLEDQYKRI